MALLGAETPPYSSYAREAAARGMTVSDCVRRELKELYAFRDELGDALRIPGDEGAPARGLLDSALKGLEARMAGNPGAQLEYLERLSTELAKLEEMIDRFYLGVMLHLDDVPEQHRTARLKRASERHRAWLAVVELAAAPLAAPADDVSAASNDAEAKPNRTRRRHGQRS